MNSTRRKIGVTGLEDNIDTVGHTASIQLTIRDVQHGQVRSHERLRQGGGDAQLRRSRPSPWPDPLGREQSGHGAGTDARRPAARPDHAAGRANRSRSRLLRALHRHPRAGGGDRAADLPPARRAEGRAQDQRADDLRHALPRLGGGRLHGPLQRPDRRVDPQRSLHRSHRGGRRRYGAHRHAVGFQPDRPAPRAGPARAGGGARIISPVMGCRRSQPISCSTAA